MWSKPEKNGGWLAGSQTGSYYYLTFDLGTTALKTALIDEQGRLVDIALREYQPRLPAPGQVVMDAQEYWRAVLESTREVLSREPNRSQRIRAIGFSSQGQTFVPIDRAGQPLCEALVWLDSRASGLAAAWEASWLSREEFRLSSGYPSLAPELTCFKIAWLKEHLPAAHRAWKFLCLPDYLIFHLAGETATDPVTARMSGLFDQRTLDWHPAILEACAIQAGQLPTVLAPGAVAGTLLTGPAHELGLPPGLPVCTGSNDQLAGALGVGNVRAGLVSETTGTALAVISSLAGWLDDPELMVGRHAVPGLFYAMSYANTSAVLLTWFRELCGQSGLSYPEFLREAAAVPPGSEGLTVLPHFMGKPPPRGDSTARGAILGLSLSHTRAHIARAMLESCACLLRGCLEPLTARGLAAERVRSLGGAARSDLWLQIKADLLGLPVERPLCQAAASLGAAMLAACGTGQFASLPEASAAWYHPAAVFEPNPSLRPAYEALYARYRYYSDLIYSPSQLQKVKMENAEDLGY